MVEVIGTVEEANEAEATSDVAMVSLKLLALLISDILTWAADDNDDFHYTPNRDNRDDRRGAQRRRYNDGPRGAPRQRYEEPPHAKLRRMILNIASSTRLPQDEAIEIAEYLRDHFDDDDARTEFYDAFIQLYVADTPWFALY